MREKKEVFMQGEIEVYKVIVPMPIGEGKRFCYEIRDALLNSKVKVSKDIPLESSPFYGAHKVVVWYYLNISGDPFIPVIIEMSEIFSNLNEFKEFLKKTAA